MGRSIALASVVVVAFAAVGCKKDAQIIRATATIPVNVTIVCAGDSAVARINPYSVNLPNTDTAGTVAEWVLSPESTVDSVVINEKTKGKWPFDNKPPYTAKKNNPGKGNGVKKHANGNHIYAYSITAYCTLNGASKPFVIDPDMIIIWKTRAAS